MWVIRLSAGAHKAVIRAFHSAMYILSVLSSSDSETDRYVDGHERGSGVGKAGIYTL
jgi:hypothetical protein